MSRTSKRVRAGRNTREPLLVLLGAGASVPWIPGVAQLTDYLLNWKTFRAPQPGDGASATSREILGPQALAPLEERGASDARPTFFQGLRQVVARTYNDPDKALNFESLIYACDELAHMLPNEPDRDDRFRWVLESFFQLRPEHTAWGESRSPMMLSLIAEEARYFILQHVADASERAVTLHPVAEGLRTLADQFFLRLHSLNYDDLPLATGLNFETGFDPKTGEFRPKYPWPADVHSFVQLHGSVRWGVVDSEIRCFDSIDKARGEQESRYNQRGLQDGRALPLSPMITGLRKADLVLERPYGTYFHLLRDHLLSTSRWLIVGYGFGDQHVNRALQQAWANWGMRSTPARAVIVNFLPSGSRNTVEDGVDDNRGWAKVLALLAPVFRKELEARWHLRNARRFPENGLINVGSDRLGLQLDGGSVAMNSGLQEIVQFLEK